MTERPFIPSNADRLLQQHRPSPPVCSGPERRKDGAKRLFPGFKPDQSLAHNMGSTAFTPNTTASNAVTKQADNALSP